MRSAEKLCRHIPHLEKKEVFGSMKQKPTVPIWSEVDSHRLDKVKFSHPQVQIKSTAETLLNLVDSTLTMPHVKHVLETKFYTLFEFHIARISIKSKKKCHAI